MQSSRGGPEGPDQTGSNGVCCAASPGLAGLWLSPPPCPFGCWSLGLVTPVGPAPLPASPPPSARGSSSPPLLLSPPPLDGEEFRDAKPKQEKPVQRAELVPGLLWLHREAPVPLNCGVPIEVQHLGAHRKTPRGGVGWTGFLLPSAERDFPYFLGCRKLGHPVSRRAGSLWRWPGSAPEHQPRPRRANAHPALGRGLVCPSWVTPTPGQGHPSARAGPAQPPPPPQISLQCEPGCLIPLLPVAPRPLSMGVV